MWPVTNPIWHRVQVQGSGFRVKGSKFGVQVSGFGVQGSGFGDHLSGFRVGAFVGAGYLHAASETDTQPD